MMGTILAYLVLLSFSTVAKGEFQAPPQATQMREAYFVQKIDHSGAFPGTFRQRYWIDSEFASGPLAPVLLRIGGELPGDAFIPDMAVEYARLLHAHLIYIEHRYYGVSLPFPDTSTEHLKVLTLANVLADLVDFENFQKSEGLAGKWISIGGSYSGTLSAIYRFRHPEMVVGALAASAPMKEKDFDQVHAWGGDYSSTDPSWDPGGGRQWAYQGCTEFSFWMADSWKIYQPSVPYCQGIFGEALSADSAAFNRNYFDPLVKAPLAGAPSPSQILFTNGTDDIWSQLTINERNNHNPGIFTKTIAGAGHHYDLRLPGSPGDSPAVAEARALFLKLAQQWLGD